MKILPNFGFKKGKILQNFKIESKFSASEDQEKAIEGIVAGFQSGNKYQTLLGVPGSCKQFTLANITNRL